MADAEKIEYFLNKISRLIKDLKSAYPNDTEIDKLHRRFKLARSDLPAILYEKIGNHLIEYTDQIIDLYESKDFNLLLFTDYSKFNDKPDVIDIIERIKSFALTLNETKQLEYIDIIYDLLTIYVEE